MKLFRVGFGGPGMRLLDQMEEYEDEAGVTVGGERERASPVVVSHSGQPSTIGDVVVKFSDKSGLYSPDYAALKRQMDRDAEGGLIGLQRAVDDRMGEADGFLLVGALGDSCGSVYLPIAAEYLDALYDRPTYVLGVLPGRDETSRHRMAAGRSLAEFPEGVPLLAFDNDRMQENALRSVRDEQETINRRIAERTVELFGGLPSRADAPARAATDRLVGDGATAVGAAATEVELPSGGLVSGLLGSGPEPLDREAVASLAERALNEELSAACELSAAGEVLLVISGPEERLDRDVTRAVAGGTEDRTGVETTSVTVPVNHPRVTVTALVQGVDGGESLRRQRRAYERS
jgi:cell division GTPase FtsZ